MFNPATIILAREARGFTQDDLASKIGLSQANLSKIEKGLLGVGPETLEKLSEALDFPVTFFHQSEVLMRSNFYYRKRYDIKGKSLKMLRAKIAILTYAIGN
ncbi:MAG TPA: helix-turn-helix transcriptional regulator, partial [Abditibacteriaceae bacterium]